MSPDQAGAPADDTLCMCEVCEIHRREDAEHAAVHARAEAALASAERMANGLPPFQVGDIVRETRNDAWGDVDAPVVRVCQLGVVVMAHPVRGEGGFEPHTLRLVTPAPQPEPAMPESWFEELLDNLTHETSSLREFFSFTKPEPEPIYMYGVDPASPDGDAAVVVGRVRPAGGLNIDDTYFVGTCFGDNSAFSATLESHDPKWPTWLIDAMNAQQRAEPAVINLARAGNTAWGTRTWGWPVGKVAADEAKDAQNMYNYWNSKFAEYAAEEQDATPAAAPANGLDSLDGLTSAQRKQVPIATGVVDYFPDALAAVAAVSKVGGEQHNPGKPLFWDRTKSTDEADCLMRHFVDRGTIDTDGMRHSAKVAWRALALLQKEIEAAQEMAEDMKFYSDLVG